MEKVEKRRIGFGSDKHKEVKLVHEVKKGSLFQMLFMCL